MVTSIASWKLVAVTTSRECPLYLLRRNITMFGQTRLVKKALLASALLLASNSLWAAEHWIDVRAPEQYKETHVEGAVNIPLEQIGQRIQEVSQDKNDTLHLYCNTGNKSGKAETLLKEMGYKNVVNDGGLKNVEKTQIMVKQ